LMWKMLSAKGAVGTVAPVDFHLSMESGVTTNAQAGSPQDSTGTPVVSPMGHLEVGTRFTVPTRTFIRPALGVEARLNGFTAQSVKKYSSIDIAYLPGILFGRTTTLLLSYRGSLMMLAWPGKTLFRETHRAELELTHPNGQLFFANAGKRIYKENGRTRWELEAGYGRSKTLNGWTALLLSVNGRYYNAIGAPYDEIGAGLLAAAQFSLPRRFALKSGIGESADYFFNSGGPKGMDAFGINTRRRDWTIRHFDELWFPPLKKIKLGVRYEFNHRDSNANASNSNISYDYLEHRILLKISIGITANPLVPDVRNESSHVPLNYGLHTTDDNPGINSREIAEMMRMDEAARAASSCVE
ncbi:MAG: hypothetical protein JXX14_01325, partial [Deltaproteobacteria bacterium]|nr:hypothetical protein [Deltaproteobacteria bacterium]